jgi:hypothetical protein
MEAAIYETTALIILHKKTKRPENGGSCLSRRLRDNLDRPSATA